MNIGQKIKKIREDKEISIPVLSRKTGISDNQLREIEKGKRSNPTIETLTKIASALNVPVSALLDEEIIESPPGLVGTCNFVSKDNPPAFTLDQVKNLMEGTALAAARKALEEKELLPPLEGSLPVHYTNKVIKYPIMSDQSACGLSLIPAEDEVEDWISLPEDYAVNAEIVLRAKGNCLENEKIHDGYLVFIKRQDTASSGDIVAVRVIENSHGHAILKKLKIIKGEMFLTDKSGDIIEFKENMSIVGKAIYWMPDPRKFV